MDVIVHESGKWYFWDETWCDKIGPYDNELDARTALDLYYEICLNEKSELKHVSKETWDLLREKESSDTIHPCDDWVAWRCMCIGACSCHWE